MLFFDEFMYAAKAMFVTKHRPFVYSLINQKTNHPELFEIVIWGDDDLFGTRLTLYYTPHIRSLEYSWKISSEFVVLDDEGNPIGPSVIDKHGRFTTIFKNQINLLFMYKEFLTMVEDELKEPLPDIWWDCVNGQ